MTGTEVTDAEIDAAPLCTTDEECDTLIEFPTESATTGAATSPAAPAPCYHRRPGLPGTGQRTHLVTSS